MGSAIVGCGKAIPSLSVANDELGKLVETNDEWIVSRTGIKNRRVAVNETTTDLGEGAARAALGWTPGGHCERRFEADEINLIICASATPDVVVPSEAAMIRRRLGLKNAISYDVNAACTGFIYGLTIAETMMAASAPSTTGAAGRNPIRRALVVGAERLTRITNWADRNTCVLFGDGAGAAVLEWSDERPGLLGSFIVNADDDENALTCPAAFDSPLPFGETGVAGLTEPETESLSRIDEELAALESIEAGAPRQVLRMNGPAVYKFAAEAMTTAILRALERAGLTLDDVACIVPHQANERIIKYAAKKIGRPMDFFQISIAEAGNSSAASVPMALADAYANGRIRPGDNIVLVAFGGGFTSGAVVYHA